MIRTTQAQAAHFVLNKNALITGATDLPLLVKSLGGLIAEPRLTPFLSAYARLGRFKPNDLLTALYLSGRLMSSPLLRGQQYIIPEEDFVTFYAATARQRKQQFNAEFRLWDIENEAVEQVAEAIMAAVGSEPMTAAAIAETIPAEMNRELTQTSRGGRVSRTTTVELALRWLVAEGRLYAGRDGGAAGDWRTPTVVYAPLRRWHASLNLANLPDEAAAQTQVVRTYLAAFGPATEADISFWTGFGKSETARAVNALSGETTLTMVEGIPGMTLLLTEQAEALQATEPFITSVVNVLPADDPLTTAHRASRARYFSDPSLQRQVFNSKGHAKPTILVNGQIVGTWDMPTEESFGMIDWRLLLAVEAKVEPVIEAEIERVEKFLA